MYGLFCKSLTNGAVSVHMEVDWDVLKAKIIRLDYVDEPQWNSRLLWEQLQDGRVINDGAFLWCYWDENQKDSFGKDLFDGLVVFISECEDAWA